MALAPQVTTSVIDSRTVQQDGTILVTERHAIDDGTEVIHTYVASPALAGDLDQIMADRAANINAALQLKWEREQAALGFEIPLSPVEIMTRLTQSERLAIRNAAKTDPVVDDFMDMLKTAKAVHRNHPETQAGFDYLVSQGLLTAARKAEVLA